MTWKIEIDADARKDLKKIAKVWRDRILDELEEIEQLADPRGRGKALIGPFAGYWRYRVGDYRIICKIVDNMLIVHVVRVRHRGNAYTATR